MVFWEGYVSDETMGIISPIVIYWIYSGLYHIADSLQLDVVEKHRLHTRKDVNKKNLVSFGQVVRGVIFQQILQMAVAIVLLQLDPSSSANKPLPSLFSCCIHFLLGMFIMDTYQYFMHRWMHMNKFLYRNLHSWHHRLVVVYACGALYNHPLEGLLMDTVGGGLSFLLSVYHDVHHQLIGLKYNFSQPFFSFWDRVMGTYMPYTVEPRPEGGLQVKLAIQRKKISPVSTANGFEGVNGVVSDGDSGIKGEKEE